jgi:hypothetical protein
MHCLWTREAFHAAGHGCGRRPLSKVQRRFVSAAVNNYAAHFAQRSSACCKTNLVLLLVQIIRDFGKLGEGGLEVFDNGDRGSGRDGREAPRVISWADANHYRDNDCGAAVLLQDGEDVLKKVEL